MSDKFQELVSDVHMRAGLGGQESTGFYAINCPVCKKMSRKTGGFKFEADSIIYNCFRGSCDSSCVYTVDEPVSKKFKNLMEEIGVEIPVELRLKRKKSTVSDLDKDLYKSHYYADIPELEHSVPILDSRKIWAEDWVSYFEGRSVSLDDIVVLEKGKWAGCAAITMYYYDKLIGYQIISDNKYFLHTGGNTGVIYIPQRELPDTVLMFEGVLDAKSMPNSVATLHSKVSPEQAFILRGKRVIMVPDRTSNNFLDQCFDYGWEFSVPKWDCHDANSAVRKYGVIVATQMVLDGIVKSKKQAQIALKIWSKNGRSN